MKRSGVRATGAATLLLLSMGTAAQSVSPEEPETPLNSEQRPLPLPESPLMTDRAMERLANPAKRSLSVEARLSSSAHVDWSRIEPSDPTYQMLLEQLSVGQVGKLRELEKVHLLPYGVRITAQANDPQKHLALHVDQIVRTGEQPQQLPPSALTAFVNGQLYHPMQRDLELLGESVWALHGSDRIEYQMLFLLKTQEGDRSGEYQVGFRLLSSELP